MPSVEIEERTEERTETHVCDCVSRQAAIDACESIKRSAIIEDGEPLVKKSAVKYVLEKLPSAQPQIIHCKDCKWRMPYDWMFSEVWQSQNMDDYPKDEIGCAYCDMNMGENDFCSKAERSGDTDE